MKIYVDFDDVLCETAATLAELAAEIFDRHVDYRDIRVFDLQKVFSLTDDEMKLFRKLSHATSVLAGYPETTGAAAGIRALRDAGHEVDIATGRPAFAHKGTERWLEAHGLSDFNVLYVDKYGRTKDYPANPGDPATVTMDELRARGYDYCVDDSPSVLPALAEWTDTRVMVFDRPWNREFRLAPNMTRVMGWRELVEKLNNKNR